MELKEADWSRLARYVSGEASPEEKREVEAWASEKTERKKWLEEARLAWEQSGGPISKRDVSRAWEQVQAKLNEPAAAPVRRDRPPHRRQRKRVDYGRFTRIAAAFALVVAGTWIAVNHRPVDDVPEAPTERVYATHRGERATIVLEDGSQVRINVGSTLTVPIDFATDERRVRLQGEAFFTVARDAQRPFVVEAGNASVQVLGTSFNVRAYAGAENVEVFVATGTVSLGAGKENRQAVRDTVVLQPRQLGISSVSGIRALRNVPSADQYLGWTEGRLVFHNADFDHVVTELERWYDLDITVNVPFEEIVPFTSVFKDEPLSEILQTVSQILGLRYERDRRSITFYKNDNLHNK